MIYLGICEDNNDIEKKLGRIKVRVFGVHTDIRLGEIDNKILKVSDLPWAIPSYPINTQSIDGMSDFQVPANGSLVLVTFMDKDNQHPIYFGTVPKIAEVFPNFSVGFSDPNREHPSEDYLKESPISRLARNENIEKTVVHKKRNTLETNIDCNGTSFNEPETQYGTEYPNNRVIETKSGHIIELDDTKDKERIHIYHKSGTFSEVHPNGEKVEKVIGKKTTLIIGNDNILISGNNKIRIEGNQNVMITGEQKIKADGEITIVGDKINLNP